MRGDHPAGQPAEAGRDRSRSAIAWFLAEGYAVSVPLCDNQPYDLVVDGGHGLRRVQVKTTTSRGHHGNYVVKLSTTGGNQSFHTTKFWDPAASDILFVLTDDGDVYVLPSAHVTAKNSMSLGRKYEGYRRATWQMPSAPTVVGGGFEPP